MRLSTIPNTACLSNDNKCIFSFYPAMCCGQVFYHTANYYNNSTSGALNSYYHMHRQHNNTALLVGMHKRQHPHGVLAFSFIIITWDTKWAVLFSFVSYYRNIAQGFMNLTDSSLAKTAKIICVYFFVDDGLAMPSSTCDSIRAITCVSMVLLWVKTSSTHYRGAILLTTWLFIYVFISK